MPLSTGKSKAAFSHNVSAEVHAGKPVKQAVAIAYSQKRKHMSEGGYAEGGEAEHEDSDHEMLMDHCALECLHAIKADDGMAFRDAFQTLVADILNKVCPMEEDSDVDG